MENNKYPIKEEWTAFYCMLEAIRRSGVTNMWGASPYLQACFPDELSAREAQNVLCSWISNYEELNKKFNWQ